MIIRLPCVIQALDLVSISISRGLTPLAMFFFLVVDFGNEVQKKRKSMDGSQGGTECREQLGVEEKKEAERRARDDWWRRESVQTTS